MNREYLSSKTKWRKTECTRVKSIVVHHSIIRYTNSFTSWNKSIVFNRL